MLPLRMLRTFSVHQLSTSKPITKASALQHSRRNFNPKENAFGLRVIQSVNPILKMIESDTKPPGEEDLNLLKSLRKNVKSLNFQEFFSIVVAIRKYEKETLARDNDAKSLLQTLEEYAMTSFRSWTLDRTLCISILFMYSFDLDNSASFAHRVVNYLQDQLPRLTSKQFVQFMFLINLIRRFEPNNLNIIEQKIEHCLQECSLNEICIIMMGLFKTQTALVSVVTLNKIVELIEQNSRILNGMQLSIVLKFLSYHNKVFSAVQAMHIQNIFEDRLPLFNSYNCAHILTIGQYRRTYNRTVTNFCMKKLFSDIESVRLKEIEKLLQCLCFLNIPAFEGIDVVGFLEEELRSERREGEIRLHPKSLVNVLFNLSLFKPLSDDLVRKVLNNDFIKEVPRERYPLTDFYLFNIAVSTMVEKPGYSGPMPDAKFLNRVRDALIFKVADEESSISRTMLQRIEENVEKSKIAHIVPSYAMPDVVFCETLDGTRVPVPQEFVDDQSFVRRPVNTDRLKWNVIALGSKSKYNSDSKEPIAAFTHRLRLLRKLGFNVVEAPWWELSWRQGNRFRDSLKALINKRN